MRFILQSVDYGFLINYKNNKLVFEKFEKLRDCDEIINFETIEEAKAFSKEKLKYSGRIYFVRLDTNENILTVFDCRNMGVPIKEYIEINEEHMV